MQNLIISLIAGAVFLSIALVFKLKSIARKRAEKIWDPIFEGLDLEGFSVKGAPYLSGRQYHGTWQGRGVHMYLHVVRRQQHSPLPTGDTLRVQVYAGHVLEIFLEGKVGTRFAWPLPVKASHDSWQAACKPLLESFGKWIGSAKGAGLQGLPHALGIRVRVDKTALKSAWLKEGLSLLKTGVETVEKLTPLSPVQAVSWFDRWTVNDRLSLHRALWGASLGLLLLCFAIVSLVN